MKNLVFYFVLLSGMAHAEVLNLVVEDFNFAYENPYGKGSASQFSREPATYGEGVFVEVNKVGPSLYFEVSGAENSEFEFKNAPEFLLEAETMKVEDLSLNLTDHLNLSLGMGNFYSKENQLELSGLDMNCSRNLGPAEVIDQIITGCIQEMMLKSSRFSTSSEEALVNIFSSAVMAVFTDGKEMDATSITQIDVKTRAGKYELSAIVKAQISGKVKSRGFISYDKSGKLSVKISEVKFGILNITGKVFDELKKHESDKLVVKEPYVHYLVK